MNRPRTLRFRYSLRTLLICFAVICLWCGWQADRAARERAAERVLLAHEAYLLYGLVPAPLGSQWDSFRMFRGRIREQVWGQRHIREVSLVALNDAVLEALDDLPYLKVLRIDAPTPENQSIEAAQQPRRTAPPGSIARILDRHDLVQLDLDGWILSDSDYAALSRNDSLEHLSCTCLNLSEDRLARLVALPRLRRLDILFCQVTGSALAAVPGSASLREVNCSFVPVGEEFARFIARSPGVRVLHVADDSVNDAFVAALGAHPALEHLSLVTPHVTDASVPNLQWHEHLRSLRVESISQEGAARIRQARPRGGTRP